MTNVAINFMSNTPCSKDCHSRHTEALILSNISTWSWMLFISLRSFIIHRETQSALQRYICISVTLKLKHYIETDIKILEIIHD